MIGPNGSAFWRIRVALLVTTAFSLVALAFPGGATGSPVTRAAPERPAPETPAKRAPEPRPLPAAALPNHGLPQGERPPVVPPGVSAGTEPTEIAEFPSPSSSSSVDAAEPGAQGLVLRPGFLLGDTSLVLYFDIGGGGVSAWSSWLATVYDPETGTAQRSVSMSPADLARCGAPRTYCHSFGADDGWSLVGGHEYFVTVTATLRDGSEVTSDPSALSRARRTIVPPAVSTPQAASCGCPTALAYSAPIQAVRGAGVRTGTGAFHWARLDLRMASFAVPFNVARTYSSANTTAGGLGRGWAWTYDVRVIPPAGDDPAVTVRAEDGAQVVYRRADDGSYQRPHGVRSTLTRAGDGGWRLVTPGQVTYAFDADGRLTSIRNTRGDGVSLTYQGDRWTITDAAGRMATVRLNDAGLVRRVELPDGRHVGYRYTDGLLTTVIDVGHHRWRYAYTDGLLSKVVDPRGRVQVANTYAGGRVVSQRDAGGAVTTFAWDADRQEATTTDPDGVVTYDGYRGNVLVYSQNGNGDVENTRYDRALNGNLSVDPKGNQYEGTYDGAGNRTALLAPEPFSFTERRTFDGHNNQTSFTDGEGNTGAYAYTSNDELAKTTDRSGNETHYRYDDRGLLVSVTDPLGKVTRYEYDADGNRVARHSPSGATTTYTYDKVGRRTSRTGPRGNEPEAKARRFTTRYDHDGFDRLRAVWSPGKHRPEKLTYDELGQLVATSDPLGRTTRRFYDKVIGRLDKIVEPGHRVTRFALSAAGRRISVKDPEGNLTTFTYDHRGQISTTVSPRGNEPGADKAAFTTTYIYDQNGNLLRTSRPYPGGGVVEVDVAFDELDRARSTIDPLGNRFTATLDNTDNIVSTVDPLGRESRLSYDANGRPQAVTAPGGGTSEVVRDKAGQVIRRTSTAGGVTTWTYDDDGRPATITEPRGNADGADPKDFTTYYTYDAAGNLTTVTDPLGNKETFGYDENNRLVRETDGNGHSTRYRNDDADQIVAVIAPDRGVTRYRYHKAGTTGRRIDANGHVTRFAYDDVGALTATIDPLGRVRRYRYDAEGNLTTILTAGHGKPDARTITDTYDTLNRRVRRKVGVDGPVYAYGYDVNNRLVSLADPAGVQRRGYDDLGRLTEVERNGRRFAYTYDGAGNVVRREWPDGTRVDAAFDRGNRLTRLTAVGGVAGPDPSTYTFGYDLSGRPTTTTFPAATGLRTVRTYDRAGRLAGTNTRAGTADPVAGYRITRDPVGNPARIVTTRGGASETTVYDYDPSDRITAACYGVEAAAQRHHPECPRSAGGSVRYRYDQVGNRLTERRTGTLGDTLTRYRYDAADQLQAARTVGDRRSLQTFDYDHEGNQVRSGKARYTYHLDHTLASATVAGETTRFGYDGDGLRISANDRAWTWDVNGTFPTLALEAGPDGERGFLPGPGHGPMAMLGSGARSYVPDWLGGVAAMVSPSGEVAEAHDYEPYGAIRTNGTAGEGSAAGASPLLFAGMYADPVLNGQYALPLRTYDQTTGRFGGVDPVPTSTRDPASSTYAYVLGRPTVLLDLTGGRPIPDGGGGSPVPRPDPEIPDPQEWDKFPWELPCTESPAEYCRILLYIHDEIVRNSQSDTVHQIKGLLEYSRDPGWLARLFDPEGAGRAVTTALGMWTAKVCQRVCPWDHKPKIREKFNMNLEDLDTLYSDVPATKYRIFYDVWSNIHYGYVGRIATFTEQDLQDGAGSGNPLAGTNDEGDVITVQVGIDLAHAFRPDKLGPENIDYKLRSKLDDLFVAKNSVTVILRK